MAFIDKQTAAGIRKKLKAELPGYKISARVRHHSALDVTILSGPERFSDSEHSVSICEHHVDQYENADVLKKIFRICNEGNFDESDVQTDYFHVGWYLSVRQGDYDRPYQVTA